MCRPAIPKSFQNLEQDLGPLNIAEHEKTLLTCSVRRIASQQLLSLYPHKVKLVVEYSLAKKSNTSLRIDGDRLCMYMAMHEYIIPCSRESSALYLVYALGVLYYQAVLLGKSSRTTLSRFLSQHRVRSMEFLSHRGCIG